MLSRQRRRQAVIKDKAKGMRRDPFEIMNQIFKALEEGQPVSINELAHETGLHNVTVRKYIRIIEMVRREPQVEVIKTSHSIIVRVRR